MLRAQPDVVFSDDFKNNDRGWWEIDNQNGSSKVANGVYTLSGKRPQSWWYSPRGIFIDPTKDFTIEAVVRQNSGTDQSGYGLTWGGANGGTMHVFMVAPKYGVRVSTAHNGQWTDDKPWAVVEGVKPMGSYNTLKIEKRGQQMRFTVNGKEVATTPMLELFGLELGIMVNDVMAVDVDKITVRQKQKLNLVPKMPKKLTKINLGKNVNSEYDEIGPVISSDGSTLYFSCNYHPQNAGGVKDADEIWMSRRMPDSSWGPRERLGRPLNNEGANWVISVTPDNNTLLIANRYKADGSPNGSGLSLAQRNNTGWSVPRDVVLRNLVNNSDWYQFSLSPDRKVLVMSLQGRDTRGDHDLYVSFLQNDGTWSEQKNIGETVNTLGFEASPFLAADGVTLFFSSNGRPGYGEGDIYVTRRLDDSWTKWSEPENLGPAINTVGRESYFTLPASGEYAYMNSSYNSFGKSDIFKLKLPASLRPMPVVLVYGNVLNSKTKEPLGTAISYRDLGSDKEIGIASSNPSDGSYKIALPAGKVYSFMAEQKGFYAVSDNLDLKNLKDYREIRRDLLLTPVEEGATIRLNNIFFDFAESTLRAESQPELNRAAQFLRDNPSIIIEVGGHTDNVGADDSNMQLSENRARVVMEYMVAQGIPAERMTSKGYGESKPIGKNSSEEGRQMNRRVEFTIVKR
jgi:outer membrane protein OmpA-like peptidoglycan-associated protein